MGIRSNGSNKSNIQFGKPENNENGNASSIRRSQTEMGLGNRGGGLRQRKGRINIMPSKNLEAIEYNDFVHGESSGRGGQVME